MPWPLPAHTPIFYLPVAALAYVLWKIAVILTIPFRSSIRHLRGPPGKSWLFGNILELDGQDVFWVNTYGPTFKFKDWMKADTLYTIDTKAIHHVLIHSYDYPKPKLDAFLISEVFGHGLLVVEGDRHRKQRRTMNPAFGLAQLRELSGIFVEKARELRDLWEAHISASGDAFTFDVAADLSKTTLDVIGLAGFNYVFDALDETNTPNELNVAFASMFQVLTGNDGAPETTLLLNYLIPPARHLPSEYSRRVNAAQQVTRRIGMRLIQEKKAEIMKAALGGKDSSDALRSRDLLTLLIKANMNADIPEHQRLSDEDVLAQVPTFLIAGHETTSYGMAWCLFALSQAPDAQRKLRKELFTVQTEAPSMEELNALPYLDAVIREALRIHPPVRHTIRMARQDDVIPFGTPFEDRRGRVHDHVRIRKGMEVLIPIQSMNTSKAIWGEDAFDFRPERWEEQPALAQSIPGIWGNLMTFLGGPRACIGYRFALTEMKALIFVLVRTFAFELALPAEEIIKRTAIVQRPYIRGAVEKGSQLPLRVKLYKST
ncbi:cytochrome P450 [Daedalea quercina L-15889]|uniref:Cytochrome P450 n=1 Tax=Daedalea quercina L-15889 TaxID=1314783 RepID=A0A165RB05_9APHY|nr:cytochrome P450 [Daedalea quercina L-15889]